MPNESAELWLKGEDWSAGWALDYHSSADPSKRTETGELLNRLKYHADKTAIAVLAERATQFLRTRTVLPQVVAIIPVPPSDMSRSFQPVPALAAEVGQRFGIAVATDYLIKRKSTTVLKAIDDPVKRKAELAGAFEVADERFAGKRVLVFDDIYRSGETMAEVCKVLKAEGKLARIYVMAITRTRFRK